MFASVPLCMWCLWSKTFEMESPQDHPLCVAAHPTQRVLALGFKSGAVRVLAVEGPVIWMEANTHSQEITGLWFVKTSAAGLNLKEQCFQQQQQHVQTCLTRGTSGATSEDLQQYHLVVSLDAAGCE